MRLPPNTNINEIIGGSTAVKTSSDMTLWIIKIPQVKSPKMNNNIGEQVACGSNLGISQIKEPVLVKKWYEHKENLAVCIPLITYKSVLAKCTLLIIIVRKPNPRNMTLCLIR